MTHVIVRVFLAFALLLTFAGRPAATPSAAGHGGGAKAHGGGAKSHADGGVAAANGHEGDDEGDGDDQDPGDDQGEPEPPPACGTQPSDAQALAAARAA